MLSREWGNGSLSLSGPYLIPTTSPYNPFPHSLLRARQRKFLEVPAFSTEADRDTVSVNGIDFSGTEGPDGLVPAGSILWQSDARYRFGIIVIVRFRLRSPSYE